MKAGDTVPTGLVRGLTVGVALWGVGVQISEALAAAGMAMTATGVLMHAWRHRRPGAAGELLRAWWPLWAFIGWALLVPLLAAGLPSSAGVARVLDWAAIPVAAYGLRLLPGRRRIQVAIACGAVLCISCAAAVCQRFGLWPPPEAFTPLAWTRIPFFRMYEHLPGANDRFMAGGLLFHRLKFANVESMATLCALAFGLSSKGRLRWLGLGIAAVGFLSVTLLPHARAASVALLLSTLAVLYLALPARRTLALALGSGLVALAAAAVLVTPSLRTRFATSLTSEGSGERRAFLEAGLRAVRAHPLAGVGLGRFRPSLFAAGDSSATVLTHGGKTHNQLLSLAAEAGIPAALLLGLLLAWLWRRLPREPGAGAAGQGCLLLFALLGLLHDPLFHAEVSMALALALGAGLSGPHASAGLAAAHPGR